MATYTILLLFQAQGYNVSVEELQQLNPHVDFYQLSNHIGETITVTDNSSFRMGLEAQDNMNENTDHVYGVYRGYQDEKRLDGFVPQRRLTGSNSLLIIVEEVVWSGGLSDDDWITNAKIIPSNDTWLQSEATGVWDYILVNNIDEAAEALRIKYQGKKAFIDNLIIGCHGKPGGAGLYVDIGVGKPQKTFQVGEMLERDPLENNSLLYISSLLTEFATIAMTACDIIADYAKGDETALETAQDYYDLFIGETDRTLFLNTGNSRGGRTPRDSDGDEKADELVFLPGKGGEGLNKYNDVSGFIEFNNDGEGNMTSEKAYYNLFVDPMGEIRSEKLEINYVEE